MSEQKENEEEKGTLEVNSVFFEHSDNTDSRHFTAFMLILNNREYLFYIKERMAGNDMYYIPLDRGYVKLWQDKAKNILFYVSLKPLNLFANDFRVYDTYNICDKNIKIKGPLEKFLIHYDVVDVVKWIICNKFDF